ncbi:MAG: DUF896 domain-containing protein [Saccharofermentans sp.]|nr:DUF896 domain-containing protein [Saccharofermentans sp.]
MEVEFDQLIKRINELSRKSKSEGLSEAEKAEQTELRNQYRAMVVGNLSAQLNTMKIQYPDGTIKDVKKTPPKD